MRPCHFQVSSSESYAPGCCSSAASESLIIMASSSRDPRDRSRSRSRGVACQQTHLEDRMRVMSLEDKMRILFCREKAKALERYATALEGGCAASDSETSNSISGALVWLQMLNSMGPPGPSTPPLIADSTDIPASGSQLWNLM